MLAIFLPALSPPRTWRNAQLGDRIIMQLEDKGKQMTDELKGAIDKLNEEASALELEKEKKEVNSLSLSVTISMTTTTTTFSTCINISVSVWENNTIVVLYDLSLIKADTRRWWYYCIACACGYSKSLCVVCACV